MVYSNLGFEDEDAAALGFPDVWTVAFTATASSVAGYDDESDPLAGPDTREDFEGGWDTNASYTFAYADPIDLGELEAAIYDTALPDLESIEDFEEGWSTNQNYLFELSSVGAASYDTTIPEDFEDFEDEWSNNETYFFDWGDVEAGPGTEAASFDTTPQDFEDLEEEWDSNEFYDFTMAATITAVYDGMSPENFEDFEEVIPEFIFTVTTATNQIMKVGHGLSNDQHVSFRNEGGRLPDGLSPRVLYFVISASADNFRISQTLGGSTVTINDDGIGTHFAIPDQTLFWTSDVGPL